MSNSKEAQMLNISSTLPLNQVGRGLFIACKELMSFMAYKKRKRVTKLQWVWSFLQTIVHTMSNRGSYSSFHWSRTTMNLSLPSNWAPRLAAAKVVKVLIVARQLAPPTICLTISMVIKFGSLLACSTNRTTRLLAQPTSRAPRSDHLPLMASFVLPSVSPCVYLRPLIRVSPQSILRSSQYGEFFGVG